MQVVLVCQYMVMTMCLVIVLNIGAIFSHDEVYDCLLLIVLYQRCNGQIYSNTLLVWMVGYNFVARLGGYTLIV